MGFVVDKVALGLVFFSECFGFSAVIFPSVLHTRPLIFLQRCIISIWQLCWRSRSKVSKTYAHFSHIICFSYWIFLYILSTCTLDLTIITLGNVVGSLSAYCEEFWDLGIEAVCFSWRNLLKHRRNMSSPFSRQKNRPREKNQGRRKGKAKASWDGLICTIK